MPQQSFRTRSLFQLQVIGARNGRLSQMMEPFSVIAKTRKQAMSARFDVNTFTAQYTQWNVDKGAQNGTAIEYKSEDSRYRVYIPGKNDKKSSAKAVSGGGLHVVLACDHIIGGVIATDDHTTVTMDFDASGALKDASQEIEITEGGVHPIPDWVPKALELGVEALGALGALETAGISEVVA